MLWNLGKGGASEKAQHKQQDYKNSDAHCLHETLLHSEEDLASTVEYVDNRRPPGIELADSYRQLPLCQPESRQLLLRQPPLGHSGTIHLKLGGRLLEIGLGGDQLLLQLPTSELLGVDRDCRQAQ